MRLTIKPEINNRKSINGCSAAERSQGLDFDSEPYHVIEGNLSYCEAD
jgi:hypothetical protein